MIIECPHCHQEILIDETIAAQILGAAGGLKAAAKGPAFTKARASAGGKNRWKGHQKKKTKGK
jgi:hypothetical protein